MVQAAAPGFELFAGRWRRLRLLAAHRPPPLCCQVTFVEAMPNIMPGFDREIAKLAQRLLIQGRPIDYHTNVIASKVTPGAWLGLAGVCWAGVGCML